MQSRFGPNAPERIPFASAMVICLMLSPKTPAATGTAFSAAWFIEATKSSAIWFCPANRSALSTFCNFSGMGIFTFRFVRKPPSRPNPATARSTPLPSASFSPPTICSCESPAAEVAAATAGLVVVMADFNWSKKPARAVNVNAAARMATAITRKNFFMEKLYAAINRKQHRTKFPKQLHNHPNL